jgi:hypothetical protein
MEYDIVFVFENGIRLHTSLNYWKEYLTNTESLIQHYGKPISVDVIYYDKDGNRISLINKEGGNYMNITHEKSKLFNEETCPVGTRVLIKFWVSSLEYCEDHLSKPIEVTVMEWSEEGRVKLRYENSDRWFDCPPHLAEILK